METSFRNAGSLILRIFDSLFLGFSHSLILIHLFIGLSAVLLACSPLQPGTSISSWQYEDLRALDPLDSAQISQDLIALYLRTTGPEIQFRLDLFDLELFPDYDLLILIDSAPGGARDIPVDAETDLEWEYLLKVPAAGTPEFLGSNLSPIPEVSPRVIRDPLMDTVTIFLFPGKLTLDPETVTLAVYLAPQGSKTVADKIGPVLPSDPRPNRVPVLLAFWNTFPAYSPAQALRRWAGAHTGPFGERHGLSQLVQGAGRFSVPILLLDLKNSTSLSALDSLNVLQEIRSLSNDQVLQLPDVIYLPVTAGMGDLAFLPPPEILAQNAAYNSQVGEAFGIDSSQTLFAPILPESLDTDHRLIFQPPSPAAEITESPFETRVSVWNDRHLVQLPGLSTALDLQTTAEGLTLTVRQALLARALDPWPSDSSTFMVLGGNFIHSSWGSPQAGLAGLHYLAAHPWIRIMTETDLLAFDPVLAGEPAPITRPPDYVPYTIQGKPVSTGQNVGQIQMELLREIEELPAGPLKDMAWTSYFALLAPNPPPQADLPALRASYLGQVGGLLAAAHWAAAPGPLNDCEGDPDLDGEAECILANENLFLLFEPAGARLVLAFVLTPTGPHQWIGPLSQFLVGYGDPSEWDPTRGPAGDLGDIPGAFTDESDRWAHYTVMELPEGLQFFNAAKGVTKTFRLTGHDVLVDYAGITEDWGTIQIPLAIAPEARFSPDWMRTYHPELGVEALTWTWDGGISVSMPSTAPLNFAAFNQSMDFLKAPEDPNFDYPPGHYLPFPLALVTISPKEDFTVTLQVNTE